MFYATAHYHTETLALGGMSFRQEFETVEQRDAALASFPKFVKARASTISYAKNGEWVTQPTIAMDAKFHPEKDNAANETGAKRVRRFLEIAGEVEYQKKYLNSYETLADAIAAMPA